MPEDNDDLQKGLQKLLEKHSNDANALALQLYSDNYQLRDDRRKLKADLTEAQKGKPAEGAIVLSKEDAALWAEYTKHGKPADIEAAIVERDSLKGAVAKAERLEALRKVAEAEDFDADVLASLAGDSAELGLDSVTKDGTTIQQAYIVVTDSTGTKNKKALADYAAQEWAKFLPALKPAQQAPPKQQQGTPYLPQKKAAPPAPPDLAAAEKQKLAMSGDYASF